jgi:PAS domain S-box-containing protein
MLGYSRDELASGRIGWRELTPPEWEDVSNEAVAEIQATGRCAVFEKEYLRKDGTRVPILMASAAIDESPREIVAFVPDLTARKRAEDGLKRSESYLAEAQRLAHTGSWAASPGAERATYWSEETFRIFERPPIGPNSGADSIQFQDVHAIDSTTAYLLSIGPAYLPAWAALSTISSTPSACAQWAQQ